MVLVVVFCTNAPFAKICKMEIYFGSITKIMELRDDATNACFVCAIFRFFVGFCFCFSLVVFFFSKHAPSTYQSPESKPSVTYHLKMEHEDTRTRKLCNAACEDVITTNRPTPWVLSVIESG